jgi:hypothetical protein
VGAGFEVAIDVWEFDAGLGEVVACIIPPIVSRKRSPLPNMIHDFCSLDRGFGCW